MSKELLKWVWLNLHKTREDAISNHNMYVVAFLNKHIEEVEKLLGI